MCETAYGVRASVCVVMLVVISVNKQNILMRCKLGIKSNVNFLVNHIKKEKKK